MNCFQYDAAYQNVMKPLSSITQESFFAHWKMFRITHFLDRFFTTTR